MPPIRHHALFRLLPRPAVDAAKGSCYITGSSGPCIDTGIVVDYEGNLTLSLTAIREMAEVAGFSFEEDGVRIEQENAQLQRELTEARELIGVYEEQLDAVAIAFSRSVNK